MSCNAESSGQLMASPSSSWGVHAWCGNCHKIRSDFRKILYGKTDTLTLKEVCDHDEIHCVHSFASEQ